MSETKRKLEELKQSMIDDGILGSGGEKPRLNQYLIDQLEESIEEDLTHVKSVEHIKAIGMSM